ncbi:hypothetical protein RUND412_004512 [Rhizina undulata]
MQAFQKLYQHYNDLQTQLNQFKTTLTGIEENIEILCTHFGIAETMEMQDAFIIQFVLVIEDRNLLVKRMNECKQELWMKDEEYVEQRQKLMKVLEQLEISKDEDSEWDGEGLDEDQELGNGYIMWGINHDNEDTEDDMEDKVGEWVGRRDCGQVGGQDGGRDGGPNRVKEISTSSECGINTFHKARLRVPVEVQQVYLIPM